MDRDNEHGFDPLPVAMQRQIDRLCQWFETEWHKNNRLRIEDVESRLQPAWGVQGKAELILLEVELRFLNSELPDIQEYRTRFPEHRRSVAAAFERLAVLGDTRRSKNEGSGDHSKDSPNTQPPTGSEEIPKQIGKFVIDEKLGSGSFGSVYQAHDKTDGQPVALKFPRSGRFRNEQEKADFLREAESARTLDHPGIVKTHDICQHGDYIFIVQQLVEGSDLETYATTSLSRKEIASLIAAVADAVGFAHRNGIYHRDLKPTNILVNRSGAPLVTDFGTAIHESMQYRRKGEQAGSPAYMSPELVRGESHLIDGRSDIWSLGVILYEMLLGKRPFSGDAIPALFDEIKLREAVPLRQVDESIPVELERICLRCLTKRIGDRYLTASDLADDLRRWIQIPPAPVPTGPSEIVPQGLRAFGADEANFYVRLLPGTRDRTQLPLNVLFWKRRIESFSPELTFSVGILYGPSGSGKSSFVKAGVVPRLAEHVIPVYVEATSRDTEVRILKALRRHFDDIPQDLALPDVFRLLREREWNPENSKIVLVLDQFEHWLHTHDPSLEEQLVQALRHCDGKSLQAVVLVRDDFWLATSRFKDVLEVEFVDGHNAMLIDRFDKEHARYVLKRFGQAFGRLPGRDSELTESQTEFLRQAVDDLAEEHHVIPVHLSLFAEMFKNRNWSTDELEKVGGISGVGETFLEETFSRKNSSPKYRNHEKAVRAVLELLLPAKGQSHSDIRGTMRSREELARACRYEIDSPGFAALIELLDKDLRLVTPTDPDAVESNGSRSALPGEKQCFQLTHDYLVPSIRSWLNRKKIESWRGRALIRLTELTEQFQRSGEKRFLPRFIEYVVIRLGVNSREQSPDQQKLLKLAGRRHALTLGAWSLAGVSMLGVAGYVRRTIRVQEASALIERLVGCDPFSFEAKFSEVLPYRDIAEAMLRNSHDDTVRRKRVNALAASIRLNPSRKEYIDELVGEIPFVSDHEGTMIIQALRPTGQNGIKSLQTAFKNAASSLNHQIRYSIALLQLGQLSATNELLSLATDPTRRTEWIHQLRNWRGTLWTIIGVLEKENAPPTTISGLILALSEIDPSEFDDDDFMQLKNHAERIYVSHPDAACHAAAKYFLRRNSDKLPEPAPENHFDWCHFSDLLTLVRVPAGMLYQGAGIPPSPGKHHVSIRKDVPVQEFWLGDQEVTVGLFRQFLDDNDYQGPKPEFTPELFEDDDAAATNISIRDAFLFCDWLNDKVGRDSPCQIRDGRIEVDLARNGFRLPTHAELEYASRAGTNTMYSFGGLPQRKYIEKYVSLSSNSSTPTRHHPQKCGIRIPNGFGIFDATGNVRERCLVDKSILTREAVSASLSTAAKDKFSVEYGDHYASSSHHFCGWFQFQPSLDGRKMATGFRLACNENPNSSQANQ